VLREGVSAGSGQVSCGLCGTLVVEYVPPDTEHTLLHHLAHVVVVGRGVKLTGGPEGHEVLLFTQYSTIELPEVMA
jgi:hypothetical protein